MWGGVGDVVGMQTRVTFYFLTCLLELRHRARLRDVLGVVAVGGPTHRPDSRAWEQVPGALRVLPWAAAGAGQSGRLDAPRATS